MFGLRTEIETNNHCPFCITRETIQFGMDVIIPPGEIPSGGICSVSLTRREPCHEYLNPKMCSKRTKQDFCDRPWAEQFSV